MSSISTRGLPEHHRPEVRQAFGPACFVTFTNGGIIPVALQQQEKDMSDTPYEVVRGAYTLPFDFRDYQVEALNKGAPEPYFGFYLDPGLGKTIVSIAWSLYRKVFRPKLQTIVVIPPILFMTWVKTLRQIPGVSHVCYRGTPTERKKVKLDADFVIVSMDIFKREHDVFIDTFAHRDVVLIVDEATAVKNSETGNYRHVLSYTAERDLALLTGTPISNLGDVYAYTRLLRTGLYRSLTHFENIHVAERDFYGTITKWRDLDRLKAALETNAIRIRAADVLDLPGVYYTPIEYELDPKHYKLYREIAEDQLLELESGGKIDLTTSVMKLQHALQQVILNWDYFGDNPKLKSAGEELAEEILEEIGDRKLIVVSQYRMTNRKVIAALGKYGAVGIYGDISQAQKDRNLERFLTDPKCRVLAGQWTAMGYGVDGLQDVCCDMLFLEHPTLPKDFHQTVARLDRSGQKEKVHVRIAIASKTLQVRSHKQLMDKDDLIHRVCPNVEQLRAAIYGD